MQRNRMRGAPSSPPWSGDFSSSMASETSPSCAAGGSAILQKATRDTSDAMQTSGTAVTQFPGGGATRPPPDPLQRGGSSRKRSSLGSFLPFYRRPMFVPHTGTPTVACGKITSETQCGVQPRWEVCILRIWNSAGFTVYFVYLDFTIAKYTPSVYVLSTMIYVIVRIVYDAL